MDAARSKVGDEVFYAPLERAEIMGITDTKTHAVIRLLTGPLKDKIFEVPLGDLKTVDK